MDTVPAFATLKFIRTVADVADTRRIRTRFAVARRVARQRVVQIPAARTERDICGGIGRFPPASKPSVKIVAACTAESKKFEAVQTRQ